jgi:hypothetical protein
MCWLWTNFSKLECAKKFFLKVVHLNKFTESNIIPPPIRNLTSLSGYATKFEI